MAEKIRLTYRIFKNIEALKYQYLAIVLIAILLIYLNVSLKMDIFVVFGFWYLSGQDKEKELACISLISLVVSIIVATLNRGHIAEYLLLLSYGALALAIVKKIIDALFRIIKTKINTGKPAMPNP